MKTGFVNIFGKPNAGKSTLLNLLMEEKLAIVSPKVQTTRHRIRGILHEENYQVIFSDTPGIIDPKYKLQEKMMQAVKSALEDADLAILLVDLKDDWKENDELFSSLQLKVPALLVLNKADKVKPDKVEEGKKFFHGKDYVKEVLSISALNPADRNRMVDLIVSYLPEGEPFFPGDEISDLSTRFFCGELIREKIFEHLQEEIPYHSTVLVREFQEKDTLTKISADIIVQRETQKGIILGQKGSMIKKLGTESRQAIEKFLGRKVFLELFVKVRPKWRDNDIFLKEYGYQ